MSGGIHPGDVVRYEPSSTWCRDGYAVAHERRDGTVVLIDTFWTSSDSGDVINGETTPFEFLFNLSDYEEMPKWEWERYASTDRQAIPKHHGYHAVHLVRKGAQPDLSTQIKNARDRVTEAQDKVRTAEHALDWARSELAALEAQAVDR